MFKRHCSDCPAVQWSCQTILNSLRLKWDRLESPPLLNVSRKGQHGLVIVSPNQLHPYDLIAKAKYLQNERTFNLFCIAVQSIWRLRYTKNQILINELKANLDHPELPKEIIKEQLIWLVQNSPPRFQLHWLSV